MPKKERHLFRLVFRLFYRNVSFGPFLNTHVTTRQFVFLFNGRRHVCANRAIGGTQTFLLTCWILEPDCIHIFFVMCALISSYFIRIHASLFSISQIYFLFEFGFLCNRRAIYYNIRAAAAAVTRE